MEDFSVVVIARNEEKTIFKLLESVREIEDVVILDTGSTDSTVEIAKSLGAKVTSVGNMFIETPKNSDIALFKQRYGFKPTFTTESKLFNYAAARNYAMTLAENDFQFQPDCLPGEEYVYIKTSNGIDVVTLEDLFESYDEKIEITKYGKEFINLDNEDIWILSPIDSEKIDYGKKYNRKVFSGIVLGWEKLRYVSREFGTKDVVTFSSSMGELSLSTDHKMLEVDTLYNMQSAKDVERLTRFIPLIKKEDTVEQISLSKYAPGYKVDKNYIWNTNGRGVKETLRGEDLKRLARVLGAYISEGSLSNTEITFVCGYDKEFIDQIKEDVEHLTTGLNLRISSYADDRHKELMLMLRTAFKPLWEILNAIAGRGSGGKKLPKFLYSLPQDCIDEFLKYYIRGDGNIRPDGTVRMFTNSKKLASGLSLLLAMQGKSTGFGRKITSMNNTNYTVQISRSIRNREYVCKKETTTRTDYFYDVTTANGRFSAGLGMIPIKNCDEQVKWDLPAIKELLPTCDQLSYRFCFAHNEDGTPALEFAHCKFFRRSVAHWVKKVHEVVAARDDLEEKENLQRIIYTDKMYLHHWQQVNENRSNMLPKLEYSILEKENDDRNTYYLAREYYYQAQLDTAIKMFEIYLKLPGWTPERGQAMIFMGDCYKWKGDRKKAIETYHRAIIEDDTRREGFFALGASYSEWNEPRKAVIYLTAALEVPLNPNYYLNDMTLYKEKIHDQLSILYDKLGEDEKAKYHWLEAVKAAPNDERILSNSKWFNRKR